MRARKIFGSGWVFVTVDRAGKLALTTRPNQDTPLMDGERVLFGNDVWEHAYYLKYQKSPRRLSESLVERGRLAQNRRALCCGKGWNADHLNKEGIVNRS